MSSNMRAAFPLILVIQSTGFSSCGTQRAAPPRDFSESRITQISRAALLSAPVNCSREILSYKDFASVIAAMVKSCGFSVMIEVTWNSRFKVSRFRRS